MENRLIRKSYQFLYKLYEKNPNYIFNLNVSDLKILNTFTTDIDKSFPITALGNDFLFRYTKFQFLYWEDLRLKQQRKMSFTLIFGKKALERYLTRNKEFDWILYEPHEKYKKNLFLKEIEEKNDNITLSTPQNFIKKLNYNTELGFVNCIDFTTLINPRSTICSLCKWRVDCKKLLERNYPNIYKNRYE